MAGVIQKNQSGRRRRRRRGGNAAAMSEINITPFVDVMLVLLIIFMVAAPLVTVGVPVDLPKTAASALPTEQEEPLTVTLTADGSIMVQETEIGMDQLIPKLRAISAERESEMIYLRADGALPYDDFAKVMGALNAAGFSKIGLVTDSANSTNGSGG